MDIIEQYVFGRSVTVSIGKQYGRQWACSRTICLVVSAWFAPKVSLFRDYIESEPIRMSLDQTRTTRTGFNVAKSHTPRQELSLKKELDDIAMQTIHELSLAKHNQMNEPLNSVERIKR